MKFTHFILQNSIPEWVKFYLNFRLLKNYLQLNSVIKKNLSKTKKKKKKKDYQKIK